MSLDPAMIMQMIAQSKGQQGAPQMPQTIGNVPAGASTGAAATNAMAKLAAAMMQRKRIQDFQRQYGQPQVPTQGQGQTLSSPVDNSSAPAGMMGPP